MIETSIEISSELIDSSSINGSIQNTSAINGIINNTISIKGNLEQENSLKGLINSNNDITGTIIIGDTSEATATGNDLLLGKTAYARNQKITGTIPDNQPTTITLENKDEEYIIPLGYHNGTGKVKLNKSNIISDNIKDGISILGVTGNFSGLDVSDTTATSDTVENGKIFYNANGVRSTGSYTWNWQGSKPEYLQKFYDETIALEDTTFPDWTASTTATSIKATENITTFVADMVNYEYLVRWSYRCDFEYLSGITTKAIPLVECTEAWQSIIKRPSNLANLQSGTFNGNACLTLYTAPLLDYRNTSGTETMTYSNSYGVYPSITAHTFSSSTSNTPTVTLKTPAIYTRCNSSYFATARKAYVDNANTKYHLVGELYRIPKGGTQRTMYEGLVDTYND